MDTYTYWYDGNGRLLRMKYNDIVMSFSYGASGKPMSITYNGAVYYYLVNAQGDVVGLIDSTGVAVVQYTYDAWGRLLSTSGTAASTLGINNPLRYRSYIYDHETGLYYLQSRYYNPTIGRFINADGQLSGVGGNIIGYNQFAYCFNNPVNRLDDTGTWPKWLVNTGRAIAKFFKKTWKALSESFSVSGEVGFGVGIQGKVGCVSTDATLIIVGDEWTANSDGTTESIRKGSLTVEVELVDNVSAGIDFEYSVPLDEGMEKGLLGAEGGNIDTTLGLYAYSLGLGYSSSQSQDIELSLGAGLYCVMGGGFEISFNLSKFIEVWNE